MPAERGDEPITSSSARTRPARPARARSTGPVDPRVEGPVRRRPLVDPLVPTTQTRRPRPAPPPSIDPLLAAIPPATVLEREGPSAPPERASVAEQTATLTETVEAETVTDPAPAPVLEPPPAPADRAAHPAPSQTGRRRRRREAPEPPGEDHASDVVVPAAKGQASVTEIAPPPAAPAVAVSAPTEPTADPTPGPAIWVPLEPEQPAPRDQRTVTAPEPEAPELEHEPEAATLVAPRDRDTGLAAALAVLGAAEPVSEPITDPQLLVKPDGPALREAEDAGPPVAVRAALAAPTETEAGVVPAPVHARTADPLITVPAPVVPVPVVPVPGPRTGVAPIAVEPAPALGPPVGIARPSLSVRWRARRPRVRKVSRVVRRVDAWSVFKIAVIFYAVLYVVLLVAGVLLWNLAYTTGTVENVEGFIRDLFGLETFTFDGQQIFHASWMIGLFLAVAATGLTVTMAVMFNLIADLVGGVRITVLEEEVVLRERPIPTVNVSTRRRRRTEDTA